MVHVNLELQSLLSSYKFSCSSCRRRHRYGVRFCRKSLHVESYDADEFVKFCGSKLTAYVCEEVEGQTMAQSECREWHDLRRGRITASIFKEAGKWRYIEEEPHKIDRLVEVDI